MTDNRKVFVKKLDAQMKEWSKQIDQLKAKADTVKAESTVEILAKVEVLKQKLDFARTKLQELKTPGEEVWEDLKAGAEKTWTEVKKAFNEAKTKLK